MKIINPEKKEISRYAVRAALIVLLLTALLFYKDTVREIWEGVRQVKAGELAAALLLSFTGYLLEGLTIFCMMGTSVKGAKVREGVFIAFACEFYRLITLGNGSGVAEIHYLHKTRFARDGIETGSATVLTMIQYMIKRIAVMAFGLIGFLFLCRAKGAGELCREYSLFVAAGCLITAAIIVFFLLLSLSGRAALMACGAMDWLSLRFPSRQCNFQQWREQILLLNQSGKMVLGQKKRMAGVMLIQMGKLLMFYAIPAYLLYKKTDLGISGCVFLMALSYMLSGVIPAPSGAGSLEFVFLLFFTHFMDVAAAAPAILLFRFATWICPAIVGGILIIFYSRWREGGVTGK